MTRLVGVVLVCDLLEFLAKQPANDEVKVEINDTMETRLAVIPQRHARLIGENRVAFYAVPSYEEGGCSRDTYDVD